MEKTNWQVIEGGRDKSAAVSKEDVKEALGQGSRADKPLGLGYHAYKWGVSQNFLAHEFVEIVADEKYALGKRDGQASLWKVSL